MKFYFATNDHWYSKAHRYIANEPSTHIGIGLYTNNQNLVIDCTKPYGKLYHLKHWLSKYYMVNCLEIETNENEDDVAYDILVDTCVLTPYDWGAYKFAWIEGLKMFLFDTPLPTTNKWGTEGAMFCTEILEPLKVFLYHAKDIDILNIDFEAKTPHMAYQILKGMKGVNEVSFAT